MAATDNSAASRRELVLERVVDAPRALLWKAWTSPEHLKEWFVPKPWSIARVELDLRPGGVFRTVMMDPEGKEYDNPGVCLEVVPQERLVFTDAYTAGWQPAEKPFMTAVVTFQDAGPGKTRYTAIARHWTVEDKVAHEKMGFHDGWGTVLDQLVAYVNAGKVG